MRALLENNAWGKLAVGISPTDTTITLQSAAQGNRFPVPVADESVFYATVFDSSNNMEIVKCTYRNGATMTVVRGADGTTARNFLAGSKIELRLNKEAMEIYLDDMDLLYSQLLART